MYHGEFNERRYLLPHRKPMRRVAILWGPATPRPIPVVWEQWEIVAGGLRAEYDADELSRACAVWGEAGVRVDAAFILEEVFGGMKCQARPDSQSVMSSACERRSDETAND